MKNKASVIVKQIISVLSAIAKAKSMAIKSKTSALKGRLLMLSTLKMSKKVYLHSLSHKIHRMLGRQQEEDEDCDSIVGDQSKAIVIHNANSRGPYQSTSCIQELEFQTEAEDDDDDDKYPDLRHSLFDEEECDELDEMQEGSSVMDLIRSSKEEGEDFSPEDEIDQAADLFIMRFRRQIRLQKLESFKRFKEMLERSV